MFKDGSKSALGHIAGMVGDGGVSVCLTVVPDFMTAGGLPVKGKAERPEESGYFTVPKTGQSPHLCAHHQSTIERIANNRQV